MITYRQILSQAWKTVWKSPAIWFFGFFILLMGGAGELELIAGGYGFGRQNLLFAFLSGILTSGLLSVSGLQNLLQAATVSPLTIMVFILLTLIVIGVTGLLLWLSTVSQVALIAQTSAHSRNKEITFGESFKLGISRFWPVLGVNLLMRLIIWSLLVLLGIIAILDYTGSLFVYIILFDIFLALVMAITFATKFIIAGIALNGWTFKQSIGEAKKLVKKNWLLCAEIAIILFLIYLVVNMLLVYIFVIISYFALQVFTTLLSPLVLLFVILFLILLAVHIALTVLSWSTWTILFELLISPKVTMVSWARRAFSK